jgi:hypothetical protein
VNPNDVKLPPWLEGQHVNIDCFAINHPEEEWERHRGKYVAWTMDGTRILTSADTMKGVIEEADRLGLSRADCVFDYIPTADDLSVLRTGLVQP